jgi:hypothetical protein
MKDKFIVTIPIDPDDENSDYKEVKFKTRKEIIEFLKISMNSLDTLINHELKCKLQKHQHIRGIKIKRIVDNSIEKPKKSIKPIVHTIDPIEFRKQLIEKIS